MGVMRVNVYSRDLETSAGAAVICTPPAMLKTSVVFLAPTGIGQLHIIFPTTQLASTSRREAEGFAVKSEQQSAPKWGTPSCLAVSCPHVPCILIPYLPTLPDKSRTWRCIFAARARNSTPFHRSSVEHGMGE